MMLRIFATFRTKCKRNLHEGGFYKIMFGCEIKEDRMGGDCVTYVVWRNAYKFVNKKTFLL